mgnify:CR=1 FL=1
MSIFGTIMSAVFGSKASAAPAGGAAAGGAAAGGAAAPAQTVDVAPILDKAVAAKKEQLDWKHSIVDLMKLVGIDASFENRKSLAHELGDADYSGTAEENITLHKAVMKALAENGGKVPANLLG